MTSPFPEPAIYRRTPACYSSDVEAAAANRLEDEVLQSFNQFRGGLLRYLSSLGMRDPDREEVVQEVFLALFQHLQRGRGHDNLRGWLFRVAHNIGLKCLDASRRNPIPDDDAILYRQVDPRPNPEQQVNARQREERLLVVFSALPELDRACLSLRAEGLKYREISTVLGISLGLVAKCLTRSLDRLHRTDQRL